MAIELESGAESEEVLKDGAEEVLEAPKINPFEVKARKKGWLSTDELKEKLGDDFDPDNVVNARQFVEKGEMISELNRLKKQNRGFDERISNNNEYWKGQLEVQKGELELKRDEAIELADKDEVKKIDKQIKTIEQQEDNLKPTAVQLDPADMQLENDYFQSLPNRSQQLFAQDVANRFISQKYSGSELVDAIKDEMDKEFPPTNSRREKATLTTSKSRTKPPSEKATTDNITADDKLALSAMRRVSTKYSKKSDAEMLKIIEDSKR